MTKEPNGVKWTDKAIVILTAGIVLTAIIQAWIFNRQRDEMKRATKATQDAAYAACVNAQIARQTLREIQSGGIDTHNLANSSLAQAAAVTIAEAALMKIDRDDSLSANIGTEIVAPFIVQNIGKTAAIRPKIISVTEMYDTGQEPVFSYPKNPENHAETGFMFPGDKPIVYRSFAWRSGKKMTWDQSSADRFLKKEIYLITWGKTTYQDIFGQSHWVNFCSWLVPRGDTSIQNHPKCAAYNQTDTSISTQTLAVSPRAIAEAPEITCQKPN